MVFCSFLFSSSAGLRLLPDAGKRFFLPLGSGFGPGIRPCGSLCPPTPLSAWRRASLSYDVYPVRRSLQGRIGALVLRKSSRPAPCPTGSIYPAWKFLRPPGMFCLHNRSSASRPEISPALLGAFPFRIQVSPGTKAFLRPAGSFPLVWAFLMGGHLSSPFPTSHRGTIKRRDGLRVALPLHPPE